MVRARTPFLVLFVIQVISASVNPPLPDVTDKQADTSNHTFINVKPAAADLPTAPHTLADIMQGPNVKVARNPALLKASNLLFDNTSLLNRPDIIEVIPAGLKPFWDAVKAECSWFGPEESKVLLDLFEIIVNDRPEDFNSFEPRFKQTFGVGYGKFAKNERSVLAWLITFGSVNILRSINFETYAISRNLLDKSIKYFVEANSLRYVASAIAQCPLLLEHGIFKHISEQVNRVFPPFALPQDTCAHNLAVLFSEMRVIDITHIAALLPLLQPGNEISSLIDLASRVVAFLGNPAIDKSFAYGVNRGNTVTKFKTALSKFFELCLPDFSGLNLSERFSLAHLFIDTFNVAGLRRMLDTHPEMASAFGNSFNLLQINIGASEQVNCAALLVERNPKAVIQTCNQLQCPFFQAVYHKRMDYFDIFYPTLIDNERIPVHTKNSGLSPVTIVLIYGNLEMLQKLMEHFKRKGVEVDFRRKFEAAMIFMFSKSHEEISAATDQHRSVTLMSPEFWDYLLSIEGIEHGPIEKHHFSLLDLAIIDRNPEIVRRLLLDERTDINRICTSGPIRGNCLRCLRGDLVILKLLVEAGVQINSRIVKLNSPTEEAGSVESTAYDYLKSFLRNSPEFLAYLETLDFTDKTLIE